MRLILKEISYLKRPITSRGRLPKGSRLNGSVHGQHTISKKTNLLNGGIRLTWQHVGSASIAVVGRHSLTQKDEEVSGSL